MRNAKLMLIALFVLATALTSATFVSAGNPRLRGVKLERIGNPEWRPVDFHIVGVEIGDLDSGFAEFFESISIVLPSPNHEPGLCGICPGVPHPGPYDGELAAGIAASGFHEGSRFAPSEFRDGMGILVTYMVVPRPNAPTGSSPDSGDGPIIPHSLFPIHVEGVAIRQGKPFDPYLVNTDVVTLDDFGFPGYDGHSHFPMFLATNDLFRELAGLPPVNLAGNYVYRVVMTDQAGNGYRIAVNFRIVN